MSDLPRVLLVHNAGADTSSWDPVRDLLRGDFACEAVPLSGHTGAARSGQRLADHRDQVLDALNRGGPALLVGHCVGGAAALAATRRRAEQVRGLLLIAPATAATLAEGPWGPLRSAVTNATLRGPLTAITSRVLASRAAQHLIARAQVGSLAGTRSATAHTRRQLAAPGVAERFAELLQDFDDFAEGDTPFVHPQRPHLGLMWGALNRVLPISGLAPLARVLRPDDVQVVAGAGHVLPLETPGLVAEQIRRLSSSSAPLSPSPGSARA